jgi:cytochrome c556
MAGFFDRFSDTPLTSVTDTLRRISSLGMKYDDMIIKQSRAIGTTESMLGGSDFNPRDLMYAMAMSDISQKKYTPIFDKDYPSRRDFLRKFALNAEIDWMITTVTDEAIVYDETNYFAYPSTSLLEISDKIKDDMNDQFKKIYNHFGFVNDTTAWFYFRQFIIDGVISFEIVYDAKGQNIIGFKEIDSASIRPDIRNENGVLKKVWYQYPDRPGMTRMLYDTQVIYISYAKGNLPSRISYVENLVRSFNLLRIVENAQVMWTLMNSTWRLKMVVPIGSKSPQKARESLGEMMSLYKEDIRLDPDSGELRINGSPTMQFYKNYLFPSKNGEQVDIQTLAGEGPDMSENSLLNYFTNKLKEDSKIPFMRFDKASNGGQLTGTAATGVDREEIRFHKFINRLRSAFQEILVKPLWIQMCLKYKELEEDEIFKSSLGLRFVQDNIFEEIRRQEILQKRLELVTAMQAIMDGEKPFFDTTWLIERYLKLDKDELDSNDQAKEKTAKKAKDAEAAAAAGEPGAEGGEPGAEGGEPGAEGGEEGGEEGGGLGF